MHVLNVCEHLIMVKRIKTIFLFDINTIVNLTVFQSGNDDSISIQSENLSWLNRINDNLLYKIYKTEQGITRETTGQMLN